MHTGAGQQPVGIVGASYAHVIKLNIRVCEMHMSMSMWLSGRTPALEPTPMLTNSTRSDCASYPHDDDNKCDINMTHAGLPQHEGITSNTNNDTIGHTIDVAINHTNDHIIDDAIVDSINETINIAINNAINDTIDDAIDHTIDDATCDTIYKGDTYDKPDINVISLNMSARESKTTSYVLCSVGLFAALIYWTPKIEKTCRPTRGMAWRLGKLGSPRVLFGHIW
ncbi:hypothetical protein TrRE_jg10773 [Triparma retinervis]|uniref:Uncharacterized protein n=1 Tax=Triparma retinervis TaxID=2557542 RepID=A0A9W7G5Y8_9STRA|nr:hypothetical protein TrRE_jg10773 [Triparma retinervis]